MAIRYQSTLPSTADLVIIGGGIVGAATAFYAARAGLRPLLLERRSALCTLTTAVATGAFRLQFDNQVDLELVRQGVDLFLNFVDITGQSTYDPQIQQHGYLWLTTTEQGAARQRTLVARQHQWGQRDIEILDAADLRRRFPFLGPLALQARFRQGDGFLKPRALTMGLLAASDAAVLLPCSVTGFRLSDSSLVALETTQGVIRTDTVIIAAGPLTSLLTAPLGLDLPITTVRRQKLTLPDVPQVPPEAPMVIDEDTGVHWRPALHGAYLLYTDPTTPPSAPTEHVPLDSTMPFQLLDPSSPLAVARLSPFWREVWDHNTTQWFLQAGQYTMTPDHLPLVGPTAIPGLWINSGYSGHGVMGSPGGSQLLIDVLTGARANADNPFRPDRAFVPRDHATL